MGGRGAAEDKKEELLGAVAIKPAGWDRTGWEAFRYFLYDPDNGTILSRTPKSWLLITVFYTIYYTCLAAFWYVCLIIFFTTIPDKLEGPKWQQKESLIGKNPGIGIRPLNQDERIDSNMFKLKWGDVNTVISQADGEGDLNADFARRAQKFMEVYDNDAVDYDTFSLDNLGPCANHPYGYPAFSLSSTKSGAGNLFQSTKKTLKIIQTGPRVSRIISILCLLLRSKTFLSIAKEDIQLTRMLSKT